MEHLTRSVPGDRTLTDRQTDRRLTYALSDQEKSMSQIALKQDTMQEYPTYKRTDRVCSLGYIEKGTGKHQSNMVYSPYGLVPTVYAVMFKEPFKILEKTDD